MVKNCANIGAVGTPSRGEGMIFKGSIDLLKSARPRAGRMYENVGNISHVFCGTPTRAGKESCEVDASIEASMHAHSATPARSNARQGLEEFLQNCNFS